MSPSYQEGVAELLEAYKKMEYRMSLKIHFLHSQQKFFLKILEQLVMIRVKGFTKISKQWKKNIKEFGMRVY